MSDAAPAPRCLMCDAWRDAEPEPTRALAWVAEVEAGRTRWLCPDCARDHVRAIEGKLPSDYW